MDKGAGWRELNYFSTPEGGGGKFLVMHHWQAFLINIIRRFFHKIGIYKTSGKELNRFTVHVGGRVIIFACTKGV